MKRIAALVIALSLVASLFAGLVPTADAASHKRITLPTTDVADKTADDRWYPGFYGRLSIPSVGINVALYNDASQSTCDREDSACFFPIWPYGGMVIADHASQDFLTLTSVTVGTTGKIVQKNGGTISIKCIQVLNGHNTGEGITDENWNNVVGKGDYLTYTCLDGAQNVRICQWKVTAMKNVDPKFDDNYETNTWTKIAATKVTLNKTSAALAPNSSMTLKATLYPCNSTDKITWTSSNTKVAKVNDKGEVTAIKGGTVTITARTTSGKTAKCTITIQEFGSATVVLGKTISGSTIKSISSNTLRTPALPPVHSTKH